MGQTRRLMKVTQKWIDDIRIQLLGYWVNHPQSTNALAKKIGLHNWLFSKFISDQGKPSLTTMLKIELFLRHQKLNKPLSK